MTNNTVFHYYYETLSPREKSLYMRLYDGLSSFSQEIPLPGCRHAMLERLFNCVLYDNPRFFYVAPFYSWVDGLILLFRPSYRYTSAEAAALRQDMSRKSAKIISPLAGRTPLFCEKHIHDAIIANTHYDLQFSSESETLLGVLLHGKAVCAGVAQCVKFFMDQLRIPCAYIVGKGKSSFQGPYEPHAWNAVLLDGTWYHVDVTFDMTLTEQCGIMRYDYLNLSLQEIERDHIITYGQVGDSRSLGYYRSTNAQITRPEQINLHIQKALSQGEKHCVVQLQKQIDNAADQILSQAEKQLATYSSLTIHSNDSQRIHILTWK